MPPVVSLLNCMNPVHFLVPNFSQRVALHDKATAANEIHKKYSHLKIQNFLCKPCIYVQRKTIKTFLEKFNMVALLSGKMS
jgi:hypothetical protein